MLFREIAQTKQVSQSRRHMQLASSRYWFLIQCFQKYFAADFNASKVRFSAMVNPMWAASHSSIASWLRDSLPRCQAVKIDSTIMAEIFNIIKPAPFAPHRLQSSFALFSDVTYPQMVSTQEPNGAPSDRITYLSIDLTTIPHQRTI